METPSRPSSPRVRASREPIPEGPAVNEEDVDYDELYVLIEADEPPLFGSAQSQSDMFETGFPNDDADLEDEADDRDYASASGAIEVKSSKSSKGPTVKTSVPAVVVSD